MANHVKKGCKVLVSGEMQIDYDKESGKTWTKVKADTLEITKWAEDNKKGDEINPDDFASVEDDDDLPFN